MAWIIILEMFLFFYAWYTNTAAPGDPGHPIFDGPFTPVGASWSGSSFGHAVVEGDADPVIIDAFDDSRVVLAEKHWGAGIAMFGGMTPTYFHSPATEATNLRNNILSYLGSCILVISTSVWPLLLLR